MPDNRDGKLGVVVGIQGDFGTGKSELAANSPGVSCLVDLDYNTQYVEKRARQRNATIEFHRLGLKPEATIADRREMLRSITKLWNQFITRTPSEQYGVPFDNFIWDTGTALWDFIYPLKIEEREANGLKSAGQLDYKDANAWMRSVASTRLLYRPEANVIFLMHEQPLWVPNPENPKTKIVDPNGGVIPDGWRDLPKYLQLYLRLYRQKSGGKGRNGQPKNNVRMGQWLKVSEDESYITGPKITFPEPEWDDIQGMLED